VSPSDGPRATVSGVELRPASEAAPSPARIVVADDDSAARELLAVLLRSAGHLVEAVEDGQAAVDRVAQGGVDLVLLDILMPRLSGLEACRVLKGMTLDGFLPVILVTVRPDTTSRIEGLRIGADDYVAKPYEETELLARVDGMLRIKRLHDQVVEQKARFERVSVHDELTGLHNYRYLNARLTEEVKRAERYHEPFACLLIDIDQLRVLNQASGRAAGDAAIVRVADALRRCVRETDVVARYGGDEFLVVLPGTHFAGSVVIAERVWRESSVDPLSPGAPRDLAISVGVALYPSRDVRSKDALLRGADSALAQAKREGGHRICVFQQQGYIYTPSLGSMLGRGGSSPDSWNPAPAAPTVAGEHGAREAQGRGRRDP
jgi:two-component system cell cycle response regulator